MWEADGSVALRGMFVRWKIAARVGTPLPPGFLANLCFVGVAEVEWLQNIHSKELVCKFFGMKILAQTAKGRISQPCFA